MAFDRKLLSMFTETPAGFAARDSVGWPLPEYLTPDLLFRFFLLTYFWGSESEEDLLGSPVPTLLFVGGKGYPLLKVVDQTTKRGGYGMTLVPTMGTSAVHAYVNPQILQLKNGMTLVLDDLYKKLQPRARAEHIAAYLLQFVQSVEAVAAKQGVMQNEKRTIQPYTDWLKA